VAAFLLGLGWEALVLWWMPGKLSGLVLMTLPVAAAPPARRNRPLPEHPRHVFTLSTQTLLEQDHHLMHHLFPRVPWYRYRRLFTEMRPL
jgi:beta-carotene hydroxylase